MYMYNVLWITKYNCNTIILYLVAVSEIDADYISSTHVVHPRALSGTATCVDHRRGWETWTVLSSPTTVCAKSKGML